jgi:hypothetical protein
MISTQFHRVVAVSIAAIGFSLSTPAHSGQNKDAEPQTEVKTACSVALTDPLPGTPVGAGSVVSGTAAIPGSGHLWIFSRKKTFNGWWPQGGGETPVDGGKWSVDVTYGIDADKGNFEVVATVVDDNTSNNLSNWVATAADKKYPPIPFPAVFDGCPVAKVTVVKR